MPSPIVLINVFEIPIGTENAFLDWWKRSSDALKKEPGFIDAQLHRSLKSEARFQFVNIAHWENGEALQQALMRNEDVVHAIPAGKGNPSLYKVELTY